MGQQFTPDLEQAAYLGVKLDSSRAKGPGARARKVLLLCNASTWLEKCRGSCSIGAQDSAQRRRLRHGSSTTGQLVPAAVTAVTANANARASVGRSDSGSWCSSVSEQTQQLESSEKGYPRSTCRSSSTESTDFTEAWHAASTNFTVVTANAASDCATRE